MQNSPYLGLKLDISGLNGFTLTMQMFNTIKELSKTFQSEIYFCVQIIKTTNIMISHMVDPFWNGSGGL